MTTSDHVRNPDPRFPTRPQHPDFWLLSQVVIDNDDNWTGRFEERLAQYIDPESLFYLVTQRAQHTSGDPATLTKVAGAMIDAFILGCGYTRAQQVASFDESLNVFLDAESSVQAEADQETIERFRELVERQEAWQAKRESTP